MDLQGKNVFITGSTRGIGEAIALAFAKENSNIILNGRGEISLEKIDRIKSYSVDCIGISGDVSDYEKARDMITEAEELFGSIDILINNAGVTNDKLMMRMSDKDFKTCLDINLIGTFNMTKHVLKGMMKNRQGAILNISSVSGLIGNVGQANYAASKAGVIGFTKSVARETAAKEITCNAIAPGFITTDMTDFLSDKVKEQIKKQIPLQHFGQVEDIASTAVFLAKSSYITGQVINVDGGLVMNG